jgi:transposase
MLYAGGMSVREAARFVGVNHQTICNWVEAARLLPRPAERPDSPAAHAAVRRRLILQEREWNVGLYGLLRGVGISTKRHR